jgi:hypothetical protein
LKTFWGWHDEQLADGTIIWTAPTGPSTVHPRPEDRCVDKTAMMPRKQRTRAQNRAAAILAERRANHQDRTNPKPVHRYDEHVDYLDTFTTPNDPDPPRF